MLWLYIQQFRHTMNNEFLGTSEAIRQKFSKSDELTRENF